MCIRDSEEVDGKLKGIMETIYANISAAAKRYNATAGGQTDLSLIHI